MAVPGRGALRVVTAPRTTPRGHVFFHDRGHHLQPSPDREGPAFDPDADDRVPSGEKEREARAYLALRFPALADAPLVGGQPL